MRARYDADEQQRDRSRHRPPSVPVWHDRRVRIPLPALVVLVGPSGAGKRRGRRRLRARTRSCRATRCGPWSARRRTTWRPHRRLRPARRVVAARLRRRLTTSSTRSDSTPTAPAVGEPPRAARRAGGRRRVRHAARECRARNRAPAAAGAGARRSTDQLRQLRAARGELGRRGLRRGHGVVPAAVARRAVGAVAAARRRRSGGCASGCSSRTSPGRAAAVAPTPAAGRRPTPRRPASSRLGDGPLPPDPAGRPRLGGHARELDDARVPRRVTERVRLGTLVTGMTYRNVAHLGKIVATLDVLSGGRAVCGLGAAGSREEHGAYGWPFPPIAERYALLEDALELLPLLWGPGARRFAGGVLECPRRLLPAAAAGARTDPRRRQRRAAHAAPRGRHADACNLFGDRRRCARKVAVLHAHCADVGRDPAEVEVTHLSTALAGADSVGGREATSRAGLGRLERSAERYAVPVGQCGNGHRSDRPLPRARRRRSTDGDRAAGRCGQKAGCDRSLRAGRRGVRGGLALANRSPGRARLSDFSQTIKVAPNTHCPDPNTPKPRRSRDPRAFRDGPVRGV